METFNAPPSDERFSLLTVREAMEQILLHQALTEWRAEQRGSRRLDDDSPQASYRTDEEAQRIASTPHWTGDPELDAIEAEETSSTKDDDIDFLKEYQDWMRGKSQEQQKTNPSSPKKPHRG